MPNTVASSGSYGVAALNPGLIAKKRHNKEHVTCDYGIPITLLILPKKLCALALPLFLQFWIKVLISIGSYLVETLTLF